MTTINISLPREMYKDVKRAVKYDKYTSVSEFIRSALREVLYEEVTENGLTPAEEYEILEIAATPDDNDIVLETEEDITNYFRHLREPKKVNKRVNDKSK